MAVALTVTTTDKLERLHKYASGLKGFNLLDSDQRSKEAFFQHVNAYKGGKLYFVYWTPYGDTVFDGGTVIVEMLESHDIANRWRIDFKQFLELLSVDNKKHSLYYLDLFL